MSSGFVGFVGESDAATTEARGSGTVPLAPPEKAMGHESQIVRTMVST
jgi:hypothetical protein